MTPSDPFWAPSLFRNFADISGISIQKVPFRTAGRAYAGQMISIPANTSASPGTLLFSHGLAGSVLSRQSLALARGFYAAGYGLRLVETPFSLNLCGNGLWDWRFRKQKACYDAAVDLARDTTSDRLVLSGTSFGGLYALERGLAEGLSTVAIAPVLSGRLSLEGRQRLDPGFLENMKTRGAVTVASELSNSSGQLSRAAWEDWVQGVDLVSKLKAASAPPPISVIAGATDRRVPKDRLLPICADLGIPVRLIPNANHTFDARYNALGAAAFEAITRI